MLNNVRLGISLKRLKISATGGLFHWKCWNKLTLRIYSIEKAKTRYGLVFISLWMPKQGRAGYLLHWKCWCKVRLEIYFIEKVKIRYSWGLFYWKGRNKVRRGFILLTILKWAQLWTYFIENDEIRYGWGLILLKRNLLHWNCWSNVRLGIYAIKKVEIRYAWEFILLKKLR